VLDLEARGPLGAAKKTEQAIGALSLRLGGESSYLLMRGDAGNRDFTRVVEPLLDTTLPEVGERKQSDRAIIDTLTPDEWQIEPLSDAAVMLLQLKDQLDGLAAAVTEVSDSRCKIAVEGSSVIDLLASGCAVDFHQRVFAVGKTALTSFAGLPVLIAKAGEYRFEIMVNRASTEYLWRWLNDTAGLIALDLTKI
jgi:heterotetrameric sarcosine oxidase gamma subunit